MKAAHSKSGRDNLAVLFTVGVIGNLSDAELLARFAKDRGEHSGEVAFTALVDRHGPMVLGVCRRVTGNRQAAEDAFQAVFLVLARKACAIRLAADDSLGRWLYGVSLRVSRRVRTVAARRALAIGELGDLDPIASSSSLEPCERADLRAAIDSEIGRLPPRYRSVVVLCDLEGLSHEQVARRLRCPVGTVYSRLHRARERLRSGLSRRGLAPAVGLLVGSPDLTSRADVPSGLAMATATMAARISAGECLARAAPATVAGLARVILRGMTMRHYGMVAGLLTLGLVTTGGAVVGLATGVGDEPEVARQADDVKTGPTPRAGAERPEPPLAERLGRLRADYEASYREFSKLFRGSTIPEENRKKASELRPDFPAFVRRIADLSATAPKDPAVRDAMLWVIQQATGQSDAEFAAAASWLVRHFGDDPDAVRVGLGFDRAPDAHRDHLLLGFYASAKGRESKGLARLALAQYLERKAMIVEGARKAQARPTLTYEGLVRADGSLYAEKQAMPDDDYAYHLHLKQCDAGYLRDEAERLYEEVIAEYGDLPYITTHRRRLENLLTQPEPNWNGEPLAADDRRRIEALIDRRSTLGQVAADRLDDWHNLAVGKMAPEIAGADIHGKLLKLSDYRGRVVVLVFWGSWCGPCMREIPRERALVERMKGRPFAMLGVDVDADAGAARKVMEARGIAWPNWHDGEPGEGPIAKLYHVRGYPTVYVIDAEGKIRSKKASGDSLDQLVEKLVAEREAAGK